MKLFSSDYWTPSELILIGTFTGLIKISTLLIALAGGGMNPVTLVLKNTVATSLLLILVYKIRKFGILTLFSVINSLVSLLLMGGNPMSIAGVIVSGIVCDLFIAPWQGFQKPIRLIIGIALFDFLSRVISLGYAYFLYQEQMGMFVMAAVVVGLGYLGCFMGLGTGIIFVRELRHAGIIRE
ncbi:MptD family putative ECF transporter S component [uncultured Desulfobacter sp.]|uniref:MptD family putative ECF transporter S component n=1 Tax=uncultured Desulfobacter sp. TaxID=240139 RepID=UPI002AAB417C|nr:MptD family putative ECF transporter S component [uncultured Desulfobacter sp.]